MKFVFGAHNLNDPNQLTRDVSSFITHPDWNPNADDFDGDIALAVLSSSIQFTKFIRPACLYTPGVHSLTIANKKGTIAGWGRIETNELSLESPRMTSLNIVTNEDCLRSNPVFARITSHRTFCAGEKGKGPCAGEV